VKKDFRYPLRDQDSEVSIPPEPMMRIAYSSLLQQNSYISPSISSKFIMMHLHIVFYTYWTPLYVINVVRD